MAPPRRFAPKRLIDGMVEGIYGDPAHQCKGRSAQARLARVLETADKAGLQIPRIREVQEHLK